MKKRHEQSYYCKPRQISDGVFMYDATKILSNEHVSHMIGWKSSFIFIDMIKIYVIFSSDEIIRLKYQPIFHILLYWLNKYNYLLPW